MYAVTHRRSITDLCERLVDEFGATLPAGQIMGIVHRANHLVVHTTGDTQDAIALCEVIARRLIDERAADVGRRNTATG